MLIQVEIINVYLIDSAKFIGASTLTSILFILHFGFANCSITLVLKGMMFACANFPPLTHAPIEQFFVYQSVN